MDGDQTIEFNGWLLTADFGGNEEAEEAPGNDSILEEHFVEKKTAQPTTQGQACVPRDGSMEFICRNYPRNSMLLHRFWRCLLVMTGDQMDVGLD